AHRPGHEQIRAAAFQAVAGHVAHFALKPVVQPRRQALFRLRQVDVADSGLLETQLPAQVAYALDKVVLPVLNSCVVQIFGETAGSCGNPCQYNRTEVRDLKLPVEIYSTASVRSIDRNAIDAAGIGGYELMTRAAQAAL